MAWSTDCRGRDGARRTARARAPNRMASISELHDHNTRMQRILVQQQPRRGGGGEGFIPYHTAAASMASPSPSPSLDVLLLLRRWPSMGEDLNVTLLLLVEDRKSSSPPWRRPCIEVLSPWTLPSRGSSMASREAAPGRRRPRPPLRPRWKKPFPEVEVVAVISDLGDLLDLPLLS